jgi:ABC-type polysaccharide/polyol phosphate export permease
MGYNFSKVITSSSVATKVWQNIYVILRLSFSFAKTNFKLRNEGSYLGIFWYILGPLALFFIILFVKQEVFANTTIAFYPIYLLIGLLIFNLFTQIISASITSISSNAGFIKSIKIPTESLVLAKVIQFIFSHMFEIVLLAMCMKYIGFSIGGIVVGLLLYIPVLTMFLLFLTGVAFIVSTIGVYVSDLANVWAVISQLLFFITPIFYLPKEGSLLYGVNEYNPLYYFMRMSRDVLIEGRIHEVFLREFFMVGLFSTLIFCAGLCIFGKYKKRFAELV